MTDPIVSILAYGILLLDIGIIGGTLLYLTHRFTSLDLLRFEAIEELVALLSSYSREIAFLIALIATSGSLYFSNILGWTPCRLCWHQRILMYPLVILLGVAILFDKKDIRDYVISLSLIGSFVALYHYPIQMTALHSTGCSQFATSCSMTFTQMFGYITIPMMSLTSFLTIIVVMWKFS